MKEEVSLLDVNSQFAGLTLRKIKSASHLVYSDHKLSDVKPSMVEVTNKTDKSPFSEFNSHKADFNSTIVQSPVVEGKAKNKKPDEADFNETHENTIVLGDSDGDDELKAVVETTHEEKSSFYHDETRNVSIRFRTCGNPNSKQKLFFIMGLATNGSAWREQAAYFKRKYHVCFYDNRGVGKSSTPLERYTTHTLALDAASLLDHLEWKKMKSIHIVGISMGGMIAQELAHIIPNRICSLTLAATLAGGLSSRSLPSWAGVCKFASTAISFLRSKEAIEHNMLNFLYTEKSITENGELLRSNFKTVLSDGGYNIIGSVLQYGAVLTHHSREEKLQQLRFKDFKTLIITGEEDDIVLPHNSHWLAKQTNGKLVVVKDAAHGLPMEKPEVFNALLEDFLKESFLHAQEIRGDY